MALSWNEIKERAISFSKEWKNTTREEAEAQSFLIDFFNIFGISRKRVATFEHKVKKLDGSNGYIDLLWKGHILIEMKSRGKDLEKAFRQAIDYTYGLKQDELPQFILICDFDKFRCYNLETQVTTEFHLKDLVKHVKLFGYLIGYSSVTYKEEHQANIDAAERMGKLHDKLKEIGYTDHPLEVYLVRLLFCLFAEDTTIFEKQQFQNYIENKTNEDGSDLAARLGELFQVLDTPTEKRFKNLDEDLAAFPYVNGKLFEEMLPIASFDKNMRNSLLDCARLDWSKISPAIFGSMFQSVMKPDERRNLGAHYTSETNILKLIKPLFLDELYSEFNKVKGNANKLKEFHTKLSKLCFLDPACGCGNFLVITYRELRLLELEVLRALYINKDKTVQAVMDVSNIVWLDVDQFYGIEYEEFPAKIAEVAMWLIDHQMNMLVSEEFGQYFVRLPLKKSAHIIHGDAFEVEWKLLLDKDENKPKEFSYILGNPPFSGSKVMSVNQRQQVVTVCENIKGSGVLDYVAGWYIMAAKYIQDTHIKAAFVSTNSIVQGEQTSILWGQMLNKYNISIHFAHRTFKWTNEARGKAAVYCVIIGFANFDTVNKIIYDYIDIKGEPDEQRAKNINPYLVDAPNTLIESRSTPISNIPPMKFGNMPLDGGNLLLSNEEKEELIRKEPLAAKYIKPLISAKEFLNNIPRWCLWLVDTNPHELRGMPEVMKRIERVKEFRLASVAPSTQKFATTPAFFRDRNQPDTFILIPSTTSENRKYIPMGFFHHEEIANNSCHIIPNGTLYHFGILTSIMHMTWVKYVCGRLKSDFRYSKDIVYNNYPFPVDPSEKNVKAIETAAQKVLDVRAKYPDSSLADLYDPLTIPADLTKAHNDLDKAVDMAYRPQVFVSEANRMEYLFDLYNRYTAQLFAKEKKKKNDTNY